MTWNYRRLLLNHVIIALLILAFFLPPTNALIDILDRGFFHFFNASLKGHPNWQLFWALGNHKLSDWLHDAVFLALMISAVISVPRNERIKKTAQFLFCILYAASIFFLINRLIFRENLEIIRHSPSLVFSDSVRLSKEVHGLGIKDSSTQSFPGDHATTALFFAASYSYYANRKLAILGWIYGVFICLPRLIAGAHWLSDVAIGSGCIILFFLSWALYSPLGVKAVSIIEKFLRFILRKPQVVC